ncbi:MAG: phosphoribosylformimino-5-aminoimidazole carboxamide ribotide isomerase [Deltaproteobacteria bacterium]|nr:MAG: phosphoribosylformimino-5-aminoimidazole carboxamide ribotide isomerase [Deltaproteobacteria bacterium]
MKFRPCIDLHNGQVKQIVGSSLQDHAPQNLQVNFTADKPASWYAGLYKKDHLTGGHIIKLGGGNDEAARQALAVWPGGMQLGGGVTAENATLWLELGASHVIVTSYVFSDGRINEQRLEKLVRETGRKHLVLDLSCRKKDGQYFIVTDRWQKFTQVAITGKSLHWFAGFCDEFLVHAADVEGKCSGIELELVELLGKHVPIPTTYAGGIKNMADLELIRHKGKGRLDAAIGSALDIFGGSLIKYQEAVDFNCLSQP